MAASCKNKRPVLAVVGPTATGKTALGVALAQRFSGEVISADSMQIYQGLDVGTAKVTPQETCGIPHHGVDIEHASRRENIQNTLTRLLELGALPIINENDTVATDEITSIGDNDTLAAIVTCCIKADLLVLLSDIDGLYTANPHTHPDAKLIPLVEEITPEVMALADGAGSALGTGGMSTKLRAARMVTSSGADLVIANGAHPELLYDIAEGRAAGTRFAAHRQEA